MPSIYPTLKKSDRKHIRTEKARIRRQFFDLKKQQELITELYKKMVPSLRDAKPFESKKDGPKKAEAKKESKSPHSAKASRGAAKAKKVAAKAK